MSIWVEELRQFLTEEEYRRWREEKELEREREKLKKLIYDIVAEAVIDTLTTKITLEIDLKSGGIKVKKVE